MYKGTEAGDMRDVAERMHGAGYGKQGLLWHVWAVLMAVALVVNGPGRKQQLCLG